VPTRALDLLAPCSDTPPTLLDGQHPITNALAQKACQQCQQHIMGLHALVPDDDLSFLG
jgi:hypothetical protein